MLGQRRPLLRVGPGQVRIRIQARVVRLHVRGRDAGDLDAPVLHVRVGRAGLARHIGRVGVLEVVGKSPTVVTPTGPRRVTAVVGDAFGGLVIDLPQ